MIIPWKISQLNIYSKLILSLLLVIIPFTILCLLLNKLSSDSLRKEILMSMGSRVHYYLESFEKDIKRISDLKNQYLFDQELQNLSNIAPGMTNYERKLAIEHFQEKLVILKNSSPYVKKAWVYIPLINRSISTEHIPVSAEDELLTFKRGSDFKGSPFLVLGERLILGSYYPSLLYRNRSPVLEIDVELSTDKIQESLRQIASFDGGGAILVNLKLDWQIAADTNTPLIPDLVKLLEHNNQKKVDTGQDVLKLAKEKYLATFEYSSYLNAYLLVYLPEEYVLGPVNKYAVWFWVLFVMSAIIILSFSYWIYRLIHQPLKKMVKAFRKVEQGDLGIIIYHSNEDEFNYLYKQFNFMVSRLKVLIHDMYEQKIRSQRSELKQLQSQINPHFLYNSFFALKRMAQMGDVDNIILISNNLGDYFQFITRNASDEVCLEQEMNHAKAYANIQMIRYANRITTEMDDIPEIVKNISVPRLIVQPILENAYEHGLKNKIKHGIVKIGIANNGHRLTLSVEDNGESLSESVLEELNLFMASSGMDMETTGLLNVHYRLQLKYGAEFGLVLSRGQLGGLRVELILPLVKDEGHV